MKTNTNLLVKISRSAVFAVALSAASLQPFSASAAAVAIDSRNGAWGVAYSSEGDPATQLDRAVKRAVAYGGGNAAYIRAYYFSVPRGYYVAYAEGDVAGKGWCGNWSYDANRAIAEQKARAGLFRQGATGVGILRTWQE